MIIYLKSYQHYEDLYDQGTIDRCKFHERHTKESSKTKSNNKKLQLKAKWNKVVGDISLYFIKGECFIDKEKTIKEWLARDKEKDEKLAKAEPMKVNCFHCSGDTKVISKDLWDRKGTDIVLFMYQCLSCGKRRAFYEDGEEWFPRKHICPKCQIILKEENKKDKDKISTIYTCSDCDYKDVIEINLNDEPEEQENKYTEEDKRKYCLTKEEGQEYIGQKARLERVSELMEDVKEREKNKDLYDKVAKIKKLKITQLQDLLQKELEKNQYINLQFASPEIGKEVIIEFTVNDSKDNREEYDSRIGLTKLINKTLENTNWRLMSDGINYRLGILTGRLKGYEREEDLIKIIK